MHNQKEIVLLMQKAMEEIKKEIPTANKGLCGYIAHKMSESLRFFDVFTFQFAVSMPLWSKTGFKTCEHIWIIVEIDDNSTIDSIEINPPKNKKGMDIELIKQFYMYAALKESVTNETWAWGPAFTDENKKKVDGIIEKHELEWRRNKFATQESVRTQEN